MLDPASWEDISGLAALELFGGSSGKVALARQRFVFEAAKREGRVVGRLKRQYDPTKPGWLRGLQSDSRRKATAAATRQPPQRDSRRNATAAATRQPPQSDSRRNATAAATRQPPQSDSRRKATAAAKNNGFVHDA
jgi:hypothetical protein